MASTIVFDFDGTVVVGNGPVLAYARQMSRYADTEFLERAIAMVEAFEAGQTDRFRDGYDVVGTLAAESRVTPDDRQRAYLASREQLGSAEPACAAPGLKRILEQLPDATRVVLATNAPEAGVVQALDGWGVLDHFDEFIYNTGKPQGLGPIIERVIADGPVLSIGDIVENDLAPAAEFGADTALVGATAATSTTSVTMRALTLAELADQIVAWAHAAEHDTTAHTISER